MLVIALMATASFEGTRSFVFACKDLPQVKQIGYALLSLFIMLSLYVSSWQYALIAPMIQ